MCFGRQTYVTHNSLSIVVKKYIDSFALNLSSPYSSSPSNFPIRLNFIWIWKPKFNLSIACHTFSGNISSGAYLILSIRSFQRYKSLIYLIKHYRYVSVALPLIQNWHLLTHPATIDQLFNTAAREEHELTAVSILQLWPHIYISSVICIWSQ